MKEDLVMKKYSYFAIALATFSVISCQKEKDIHPVGSKIVFTAATEYKNGNDTRTQYSGDGVYSGTALAYERIDWIDGDQIKIMYKYDNGTSSANYDIDDSTISVDTGSAKKSNASIDVASGSSALQWATGGTHKFYGLYPSNGGTLSTTTVESALVGQAANLSIPATQSVVLCSDSGANNGKYLPEDMSYAYMVAYKDMGNTQGTVNLPFTPVVNAIEFQLKLPDDRPSRTVSQVKLSHGTTALAGSFDVNITGFSSDAVTWTASSSSTTKGITVNFKNGSATASPAIPTSSSNNVLDFTILTLPVSISDPILQIKYSDNHVMKTTLSGLSMSPGQKCIVTNYKAGHDDYTYTLSPPTGETVYGHAATNFTSINVNSKKTSVLDPTKTYDAGWKVQYKDGNNWYDIDDTNHPLSTYANYATVTSSGNQLSVSFSADNSHSTSSGNSISPFDAAKRILQSRTERSNWDLSKHNIAGGDISMTTANCYVVTAPGTYKFPCVYGNAIKGGSDNPSAYSPSTSSASLTGAVRPDNTTSMSPLSQVETYWDVDSQKRVYYLPKFLNAWNEEITDPDIYEDLGETGTCSAQLLWSQNSTTISLNSSLTIEEGGYHYITFTITKENIQPDNMVIAMIDEDGETIVWSWHIWVTDKNLAASGGAMPYNLGWLDSDTSPVTNAVDKYPDRELTLKIVQTEGNNLESSSFTFKRLGDIYSINESLTHGNNPHYQWGRKDPIKYDSGLSTEAYYLSPTERSQTGIREPNRLVINQTDTPWSTSWLGGSVYPACNVGYYIYEVNGTIAGPFDYAAVSGSIAANIYQRSDFSWHDDYYTYTPTGYGPCDYKQVHVDFAVLTSGWSLNAKTPLHTAADRRKGSIPYNLWNSYIYKEGAANAAINKFKTVYDPCPVGFTVPSADYYLGQAVGSTSFGSDSSGAKVASTSVSGLSSYKKSGARQLHATNGVLDNNMIVRDEGNYGFYWTDHPLSITLDDNLYQDQLSSYKYWQDAYCLQVTNATNVKSIVRGTAASIRPMVDPKY